MKFPTSKFISIVDDELDLVLMFKDALSVLEGLQVFAFTDSRLALEHFAANKDKYQVVISDFRMPGMNGIELCGQIKAINSNVKTVLISAFEIRESMFQDCNSIDKFLQKPIRIAELIAEINTLVKAVII